MNTKCDNVQNSVGVRFSGKYSSFKNRFWGILRVIYKIFIWGRYGTFWGKQIYTMRLRGTADNSWRYNFWYLALALTYLYTLLTSFIAFGCLKDPKEVCESVYLAC